MPPRTLLSMTPDPSARACAEAIDHADAQARAEAAAKARAGLRLCEARNSAYGEMTEIGVVVAAVLMLGAAFGLGGVVGWVLAMVLL